MVTVNKTDEIMCHNKGTTTTSFNTLVHLTVVIFVLVLQLYTLDRALLTLFDRPTLWLVPTNSWLPWVVWWAGATYTSDYQHCWVASHWLEFWEARKWSSHLTCLLRVTWELLWLMSVSVFRWAGTNSTLGKLS